jgi:hypothetical protein
VKETGRLRGLQVKVSLANVPGRIRRVSKETVSEMGRPIRCARAISAAFAGLMLFLPLNTAPLSVMQKCVPRSCRRLNGGFGRARRRSSTHEREGQSV